MIASMPTGELSMAGAGLRAPDYVEPLVGWRVWDVVESEGRLRLSSLCFRTIWQPRRPTAGLCRRSLVNVAFSRLPDHLAPNERCSCGIYATRAGTRAAPYLSRLFRSGPNVVHRVLGRVALWGTVVEASRGWRAAYAYPVALYVPDTGGVVRSLFSGMRRTAVSVEVIAEELRDYGVAVEIIECTTIRELSERLDPPDGPRSGSSAPRLAAPTRRRLHR
jgi:hypothetical protein